MRQALLIAAALAAWLPGLGCQAWRGTPKPYTPRPDQQVWVDEAAVISLVTRFVYESRFESRRTVAERQYAALVRHWYARVSGMGEDRDGGRRAVNFIHKIHRDAKGSADLWERVLALARQPPPGQDGMTIPDEVR